MREMALREALEYINESVNTDLSESLRKFLSNKGLKVTEVQATLAFMLGTTMAETCHSDGVKVEDACGLCSTYEAYIHSILHSLYDGYEDGSLPTPHSRGAKKSH